VSEVTLRNFSLISGKLIEEVTENHATLRQVTGNQQLVRNPIPHANDENEEEVSSTASFTRRARARNHFIEYTATLKPVSLE
jgi:hypothetical protein